VDRLQAGIGHMKGAMGVTSMGVVGFCYGGSFAIGVGSFGAADAIVSLHPGMVRRYPQQ
jgi:dienelactone hydrolase